LGVEKLICGAVSGGLVSMLAAAGAEAISFVRGAADDVIGEYLAGRLTEEEFRLPVTVQKHSFTFG
jgi:hypothetical protein